MCWLYALQSLTATRAADISCVQKDGKGMPQRVLMYLQALLTDPAIVTSLRYAAMCK